MLHIQDYAIFEKKSDVFLAITRCKKISSKMKEVIKPYLSPTARYTPKHGNVFGLKNKPSKFKGVGMGANDKGFFLYTHRAMSKSYESPDKIPESVYKFIESTG